MSTANDGAAWTASGEGKCSGFRVPLHYPRYTRAEYETMPEWKLNCLLAQYGLPVTGDVQYKREFAMDAFLWPTTAH